jgi:hypothetical protein
VFFQPSGAEPFFVKNLESVQGDERDVILISVGYGPDASGYMAMNFGPLSMEGGERRLNVLITRARERCEVFSSIQASDIDLNRTQGLGPRALKAFLHYARTGVLDIPQITGHDPDSVFEEEVGTGIRSLGYEVEHQVGVAGFFVDLAIRHPEHPGAFLLGVECDGATYPFSKIEAGPFIVCGARTGSRTQRGNFGRWLVPSSGRWPPGGLHPKPLKTQGDLARILRLMWFRLTRRSQ